MKYELKNMAEASREGWPDAKDWPQEDYAIGLYEIDDKIPGRYCPKPIRLPGIDGGEPEDQTFGRGWSWVPKEMNKLAKELDEAKAKLSEDVTDCCVCSVTSPAPGIPCICDNTGKAHVGMANLLKGRYLLRAELDKKQKEIDEAKAILAAVDEAMKVCEACWQKDECANGRNIYCHVHGSALPMIRRARTNTKKEGEQP